MTTVLSDDALTVGLKGLSGKGLGLHGLSNWI